MEFSKDKTIAWQLLFHELNQWFSLKIAVFGLHFSDLSLNVVDNHWLSAIIKQFHENTANCLWFHTPCKRSLLLLARYFQGIFPWLWSICLQLQVILYFNKKSTERAVLQLSGQIMQNPTGKLFSMKLIISYALASCKLMHYASTCLC